MMLRSREFLGVKLVPFGGRKRVVTSAMVVTMYEPRIYALTKSGAVAISSRSVFRPSFEHRFALQVEVALDLQRLGVVDAKAVKSFLGEVDARRDLATRRKMAGQIATNLQGIFGVPLTRAQQRAIAKLTK